MSTSSYKTATVKLYHGYGHTHNLVVYGHAFKKKAATGSKFTNNILYNIIQLLRLFFVEPFPCAKLRLNWQQQQIESIAEQDGFFKFEWQSAVSVNAGWHHLTVDLLNNAGEVVTTSAGKMFVPHITQYAFISDIDDTVMVSYSSTVGRRLRELFIKNPRTRNIFSDVGAHYKLLSLTQTDQTTPNPFFYVSSSEWNLYDYLSEFFAFNGLPQGAFLLNQIKRWFELWKTGKTKHEGKLLRVMRILDAFPQQQFVLFGDNTQSDPSIYAAIAKKLPGKIYAVYIRNVVAANEVAAQQILNELQNYNVKVCLFKHSSEAIEHSKHIGLIV